MGLIDAIDNALTNARGRHQASREAYRFAQSVKRGRTYYSVEDVVLPADGPRKLCAEWQFNQKLNGLPAISGHTAAQVWLTNGPLYDRPPRGIQTVSEYIASGYDGELVKPTKREREKAVRHLIAA